MVREAEAATGRRVGIYAELKEPYFFQLQGLDIEAKLVEALHATHLLADTLIPTAGPDVPAPLVIQCFDSATLRSLATRLPSVPLVQLLLSPTSKEHPSVGEGVSKHLGREARYGDLTLAEIAAYASGIGPIKTVFTQLSPEEARALVDRAHALDLAVHPWTFRREPMFVDRSFQQDSDEELRFFYECLNVDALFVEFPDQASMVIERMLSDDRDDREEVEDDGEEAVGAGVIGRPNGTAATATATASASAASRRLARRAKEKQQQQRQQAEAEAAAQQQQANKENLTAGGEETAAALGPARPAAAAVSVVSPLLEEAFGLGERETCLQMRKARACSIDGPAAAAFRAPSYVTPWMRRKAF